MTSKGRFLISLIVSIVFFYLLFTNVSSLNVFKTLTTLAPRSLFYAFLCYLIVTICRGLRIHSIYRNDGVTKLPAISAALIHTMISNMLPSRVGELSFVVIMNKFLHTHLAKNTFSLVYIRIFDTFVVVSFLLISFFLAGIPLTKLSMVLMMFIILCLALAALFLDLLINFFLKYFRQLLISRLPGSWTLKRKLESSVKLLEGFNQFRAKGLFTRNLLLTIFIWIGLMSTNFFVVEAMGWYLSPAKLVFAACGAVMTSLIPVPSLANVGTYESGWVVTFALLGFDTEKALITGFTIHVVNFTFSLILGTCGYLYLMAKPNMKKVSLFQNKRL